MYLVLTSASILLIAYQASESAQDTELALSLSESTISIQNPVPTYYSPNDICFVNEHEGWILGNYDLVLETKDGGISWTTKTLGEMDDIQI